jgi:3-dehydroquinate dehydratase-2
VDKTLIAKHVIAAVGGLSNITANGVCMTRLRLHVKDPKEVDKNTLNAIPGVLGTTRRGTHGVEVVFGPRIVEDVWNAFVSQTGLPPKDGSTFFGPRDTAHESALPQDSAKPAPATQAAQGAQGEKNLHPACAASAAQLNSAAAAPLSTNDAPASTSPIPSPERTKRSPMPSAVPSSSVLKHTPDDIDALIRMLDEDPATRLDLSLRELEEDEEPDGALPARAGQSILVINGPNINMLGVREPAIYGTNTYGSLVKLCKQAAQDAGFSQCTCFQSNHEGDIVDKIQEAYGVFDGIVINPAAYTHTSVAILDALKAVSLPAIEVHISEINKRENFRRISYVRLACFETITGLGIEGYRKAIFDMAEHLDI